MGGTVVASMHSDRKSAGHIAKAAGVRSLIVDFRRSPENPYPAQIDDALAAFEWLVAQDYRPAHIGSVGHSVGGFLAVMLAITLRDQGKEQPGAIVSISPRCDLEIGNDDIVARSGARTRSVFGPRSVPPPRLSVHRWAGCWCRCPGSGSSWSTCRSE
jgi:monoterpene epsilon-lactone hydrolase